MSGYQKSESARLGLVLALAGGFMDAYSYLCRGKVFANGQTGNIVLLGIALSENDWNRALRYFLPIICFAIGILITEIIVHRLKNTSGLHWRQISLLVEILIFIGVSFLPQSMNNFANSLISLGCGIQVESFRKIHGNPVATTMCVGNLRSGVQNIYGYFAHKDSELLKKGILYLTIIVVFVLGAILGKYMIAVLQEKALFVCNVLLFIAFVMMRERSRSKENR